MTSSEIQKCFKNILSATSVSQRDAARAMLVEAAKANGFMGDETNANVFELAKYANNGIPSMNTNGNLSAVVVDGKGNGNGNAVGSSPSNAEPSEPAEPSGEPSEPTPAPSGEPSGEPSSTSNDEPSGEPSGEETSSNPFDEEPSGEPSEPTEPNGKRTRNTPKWKEIAQNQQKQMEEAKASMQKQMEEIKASMQKQIDEANAKSTEPSTVEEIERQIAEMAKRAEKMREEEKKRKEEEEKKRKAALRNHRHSQLTEVCRRLESNGIVMLSGPAGTGKSSLAMSACAELFDIKGDFHDVIKSGKFSQISFSPDTMSADMVGFDDINGVFHETDIVRVFRDGGLMLFDEVDSADGVVFTKLNTMLANGMLPTKSGIITRNPEAYFVWTGNTWGTGGNSMYMRNRLDAASLDRAVCSHIFVDYDAELEKIICDGAGITPSQSQMLNKIAAVIRGMISGNDWRQLCSTRFIIHASQMMGSKAWNGKPKKYAPYTLKECMDAFLTPWDKRLKSEVEKAIKPYLAD